MSRELMLLGQFTVRFNLRMFSNAVMTWVKEKNQVLFVVVFFIFFYFMLCLLNMDTPCGCLGCDVRGSCDLVWSMLCGSQRASSALSADAQIAAGPWADPDGTLTVNRIMRSIFLMRSF